METPLITAIIAVYNGEEFIAQSIQSILRQEYPNLELIVVDDGSTDTTREIVDSFGDRVKLIAQKNSGQSNARNVGIQNASGSILGFLDADDLWSHHHISSLVPFLLDDSAFDSARGRSRFFRSEGTHTITMGETRGLELVGSALYRKSTFDRVGYFDETMTSGEDLDWRTRFDEAGGKEICVDAITVFCRRHAHNLTNSQEINSKGRLETLRKKLHRQRARAMNSHYD